MDNEIRNAIEAYANRCVDKVAVAYKAEFDRLRKIIVELENQLEQQRHGKSFEAFTRLSTEKNTRIKELQEENVQLASEVARYKGEVIHLNYYAATLKQELVDSQPSPYLEDDIEIDEFVGCEEEGNEGTVYIINQHSKRHHMVSEEEEGAPIPVGWHVVLADKGGWICNTGRDENPMPDGTPCKIQLADGEVVYTDHPEDFDWELPVKDGVIAITHYRPGKVD